MTTIGLRGLLAAGFLLSTGLLTGMGPVDGAPTAVPDPAQVPSGQSEEVSILTRIRLESCVVSLGAKRRDAANDRRSECQERIASSD